MDVTLIPTSFAINEAMRDVAQRAIIAICEQNQLGPADLEQLAHQLAQRDAAADALTGEQHALITHN